jgi:hypothetical protein
VLFYADHSHPISLTETATQASGTLVAIAGRYRSGSEPLYTIATETHAELVATLIALGEAHQALADHLCPSSDDVVFETEQIASAELLVGRCLSRSVKLLQTGDDNVARGLPELLDMAASAVSQTATLGFAGPLPAKVTEGYAFYSLYPEMYLKSLSRALAADSNRSGYLVIGIRSIGTSLAAAVAGSLLENGYTTGIITLRPRGNPFDRYIDLTPKLKARLMEASHAGAGFIVVDEGPGLSCSSFLSVCTALEQMGIVQERVILLSAWQGNPSSYASEELRNRWNRARVFHTSTEEAFDNWRALVPFIHRSLAQTSGENNHSALQEAEVVDLSYGRWRERCYSSPELWPAVHQAMERTKLLVHLPCMRSHPPMGESDNRFPFPMGEGVDYLLAKFAGLGGYGREKLNRAQIVAEAGFGLPTIGLAYGFLLHPFLEQFRPMSAADLTPEVIARLVDYYAFILSRFSKPPMDRFTSLLEIIEVNAQKGLGLDVSAFISRWRPFQPAIDRLPLVLLDGKPQPYEWLSGTVAGRSMLLKADNADHFRDHSLVGEQSILWDLAGACEEWEMDGRQTSLFMSLWARETGDHQAIELLDFFRAAYLAFRIAAVHYAIHAAEDDDNRKSLQQQHTQYAQRFRLLVTGSRELQAYV